jgi:hypothetical protein
VEICVFCTTVLSCVVGKVVDGIDKPRGKYPVALGNVAVIDSKFIMKEIADAIREEVAGMWRTTGSNCYEAHVFTFCVMGGDFLVEMMIRMDLLIGYAQRWMVYLNRKRCYYSARSTRISNSRDNSKH